MALPQSFRLPDNSRAYENSVKFLLWDQFPLVMDKQIEYYEVLPEMGVYRRFRPKIQTFEEALHANISRQHTIAGVGSLFDYDYFGHQIKRPAPYLQGSGCNGNSLCLSPRCFGFTEGLLEDNNVLQDMCWSLDMPCLKDQFYGDRLFFDKVKSYLGTFMKQPMAVAEAYQRTRLLKEAIKVTAVDKNIRYTGTLIGGDISMPFYIHPTDPFAFPNTNDLPAGVAIGGVNLEAFMMYLAPRFFAGNMGNGMLDFKVYAMKWDYTIARIQTDSVRDRVLSIETLTAIAKAGGTAGVDILGDVFVEDRAFPTFKAESDGTLLPVTQEKMEASTIMGYIQTQNPEHNMQKYRGLLFVPENWMFNIVEPPKDDFSDLGLGDALNFRTNTPGVSPVLLSSSMFRGRTPGRDGQVRLGNMAGSDGMVRETPVGMEARGRMLQEAVRTEVVLTYQQDSDLVIEGQYPNTGRRYTKQNRADGFALNSTMYVSSDVRGSAKPVLVIFEVDMPRAASPVRACAVVDVNVTRTPTGALVSCCPGNQNFAVLGFDKDMSADFTNGNEVVYRTGAFGSTFYASVTSVDGAIVQIAALDEDDILPCCTTPDTYGVRGTLQKNTGATLKKSEVFKAVWDDGTNSLFVELLDPVASSVNGADASITLETGQVILADVVGAHHGVFIQLAARAGETCDFSGLDCNCLNRAIVTIP